MKSLHRITMISTLLTLGAIILTQPVVFAGDIHVTTGNKTPTDCIATDVKGHLDYTGDHLSGNPVKGVMENIATNADCTDDVYVHIFGSDNTVPHIGDWLTSQVHITSQTFTIPQGGSLDIEVTIPSGEYCWYQVDATRTSEVKTPPEYNGNDMIDYVLVKNKECGEITPTPTSTPSATPTISVTPTEGPKATPTPGHEERHEKTVESVQATLGTSTMANTGGFGTMVVNGSFITGMIVSALGALSYARDKKASRTF